jgi:16S rRNA (uracil1498-N3)-methyltransferase
MPFNRFYLENALIANAQVSLEGSELHHLAHVMRVQEGENVELINGKGSLAQATLISLNKKKALLTIQKVEKTIPKLPQILLGIPLLRLSKLEWIVEKGTELGVDSFLFYPSELGEKKRLSPHQLERLESLLISAIKQSGRLFRPHLEILSQFTDLLKKEASIFFGDIRASSSPLEEVKFPVLFISGPESGFSKEEYSLLEKQGTGIQLNEHILRAETAPLTAASLLGWKKII